MGQLIKIVRRKLRVHIFLHELMYNVNEMHQILHNYLNIFYAYGMSGQIAISSAVTYSG